MGPRRAGRRPVPRSLRIEPPESAGSGEAIRHRAGTPFRPNQPATNRGLPGVRQVWKNARRARWAPHSEGNSAAKSIDQSADPEELTGGNRRSRRI